MSIPSSSAETCPCHGDSRKKLQDITFDGRIANTVNQSEVDSLERGAFEVPSLAQSIKNSFAPINRIPSEVLSLIPEYYHEDDMDQGLITLTHVCRHWRDTFTSCSSLWTQLDFTNVDKTRTYIQRSKTSPLILCFRHDTVIDDALALAIPHAHRLKSLTIISNALPSVLVHFRCHAPLLEKLKITIFTNKPVLDSALFNGDLSSLRELRLSGIVTHLPWKNLENLRVVDLGSPFEGCGVTRLLDFFESAPLLHTVTLRYSKITSSDAPPERIVPLRHLHFFYVISADIPHSILLHHLHIPIRTTLVSSLSSDYHGFPLLDLDYLPGKFPNLVVLSHITTINLGLGAGLKVELSGPSGRLRVLAPCGDWYFPAPYDSVRRALRSLGHPILSTIQGLAVSRYEHPRPAELEECPIFRILSSMDSLRTLVLIRCNELPFTLALDPEQNPQHLVLCSNIEKLVVYLDPQGEFQVQQIIRMVKNRASRGAKFSSIKIVCPGWFVVGGEVEKLREHVARVEYLVDNESPPWDRVVW